MPANGVATSALGSFDLQTIVALVATFLGLSVAIQVLQEVYKYFTTSKARIYRKSLKRFLGAWVDENYGSPEMKGVLVEGPFSWLRPVTPSRFKERTPAHLLPMDQQQLIAALERTAAPWVRRAVKALRQEASLQGGKPAKASPRLQATIEDLWEGSRTDGCAQEVFDFLERCEVADKPRARKSQPPGQAQTAGPDTPRVKDTVDAATTLEGLYDTFIPQYRVVADDYEQFAVNFRHAYNRRTMRQTFVLAFLMAVVFNLPFDELYRQAATRSADEVSALVESTRALYERGQSERAAESAKGSPATDADPSQPETGRAPGTAEEDAAESAPSTGAEEGESSGEKRLPGANAEDGLAETKADGPQPDGPEAQLATLNARLLETLNQSLDTATGQASPLERGKRRLETWWSKEDRAPGILFFFLLNALITAVFLSFGAPFWNSILGGLLALSRPPQRGTESSPEPGR